MPRQPGNISNSPTPVREPPPHGPTNETLLAQADALTRLARTTWISVILGCLYVWITIASIRDIQFFLPSETLTLPILQTEISPDGFFVFAPLLILSLFVYLHLILTRLWRVYRDLGGAIGRIDGLPVADRVAPWMLNHVLRQQGRPFDRLGNFVAIFFGWVFTPFTIFALSYRYLRAHVWEMTLYHSAVTALAIVAALAFWLHKRRILVRDAHPWNAAVAVATALCLWPILFVYAQVLIDRGDIYPGAPRFLTTRAQLLGAELSIKPENWDGLTITRVDRRIQLLETCRDDPAAARCRALADGGKQEAATLVELRLERADILTNVAPAALGHEAASDGFGPDGVLVLDYCTQNELITAAADLRGADLRRAFLPAANLRCAQLGSADLRESELFRADLRGARMEGANFFAARIEDVLLWETQVDSTHLAVGSFHGSAFRAVDFTRASGNFRGQVRTAFGDGSVILPFALGWPDHWPREKLDDDAFYGRWRHWRESQSLPWPPPGKALEWLSRYEAIAPD